MFDRRRFRSLALLGIIACSLLTVAPRIASAEPDAFKPVAEEYQATVHGLLARLCIDCHSTADKQGELDLERFKTLADVRRSPPAWQKVAEMLDNSEMPPKDAPQPTAEERKQLRAWVGRYLDTEARANAGDPGRIVLRRLNNVEYTYTVRDLTGVASLDPAHEFPVDGAAGEGFTNTGGALSMSPALVSKYLAAAKEIAAHAVFLPDGMRFSPTTTSSDWTNEGLAQIRDFYRQFTNNSGGTAVNIQGIEFETNQGGRLAVDKYLAATLLARDDLRAGKKTIAAVAAEHGLNAKYLGTLWDALSADAPAEPSLLLDRLRARWRAAPADGAAPLAAEIAAWQQAVWKFNSIGHIGKHLGRTDGPQSWMEAVSPVVAQQDVRLKLAAPAGAKETTLYLVASDVGDGNAHDFVVWDNPRLVAPGRPDLALRDVRGAIDALAAQRALVASSAARCLAAAAAAGNLPDKAAVAQLAQQHSVDPAVLGAWLAYLGIEGGEPRIDGHMSQKQERSESYDFVKGWVGADALSVVANSSDQDVRIPGNLKAHGVVVHPAPKLRVAVGWRSPSAATLRVEGFVQHSHPECGNGVTWALELRRGNTRQRLAAGVAQGAAGVKVGPVEGLAVRPGDVISVVIGPRDGNHSCDLTAVDLTLTDGTREWSLAGDVSPDILSGNPHADRQGNANVWHFYSELDNGSPQLVVPPGSLVAKWQSAPNSDERAKLAEQVQQLLQNDATGLAADAPDAALRQQLTSLNGPLLAEMRGALLAQPRDAKQASGGYGLDPAMFGKHPSGSPIAATSLCVQVPSVIEIRLPTELIEGCELVTTGKLHPETGSEGSVQLHASTTKPDSLELSPAWPLVANEKTAARKRIDSGLDAFRQLFPAALCYTKIVPVDEPVTLTLYFREDDQLCRLMLDADQKARLDRMWDELLYVAQEPLLLAAAFEQIYEYATQDRPDMVKAFGPMRKPVNDRAAAFRQRLVDTEPQQIEAALAFSERAFRRPLKEDETAHLRALYATLRQEELPHDEALRLVLARVLVSPAFLYHLEKPAPGLEQQAIDDFELASRLSYFLWSSLPDEPLLRLAASGRLHDPDVLLSQARRMLADAKTRRLATEFAGQWLHIHGFDKLDEKSERHFPTFNALRGAMYEESILFFTDLFQNNGSVLSIVDADYTFLNDALAEHYGIPGVSGPEWRRVDGVKQYARGGILTHATTLATQSGASRTSPILRGNWLSEVVLGEKLPRPPKNVPLLADTVPEGLTERQMIEKHSSDAACVKCHARIDPFGFALENFDAIGRFREKDAGGQSIDSRTALADGTKIAGLAGLQEYLLTTRRNTFVRQFNRKLLGYALGRAVQLSDEPLLAEMQTTLEGNGYQAVSAVEAIVRSRQFREIRGRETASEE